MDRKAGRGEGHGHAVGRPEQSTLRSMLSKEYDELEREAVCEDSHNSPVEGITSLARPNRLMREIKFRFFDGQTMCEVGELTFFAAKRAIISTMSFPQPGKTRTPSCNTPASRKKRQGDI